MIRRLLRSRISFLLAAMALLGVRQAEARESALCEKCSRGCNAQFAGAFHNCKTFTCQDEVKVRSRKCFLFCAGDEASSRDCRQSGLGDASSSSAHHGGRKAADPIAHEQRLEIQHRARSTEPWRTLAAIAMVSESIDHKNVDECEVAKQIDGASGGNGRCCDEHGSPIAGGCPAGLAHKNASALLAAYFQARATDLHRLLTPGEVRSSIDAGVPVIAMMHSGSEDHPVVIVGYREGSSFLVDDPAAPAGKGIQHFSEEDLSRAGWTDTWYFRNDAVSGHFSTSTGDTAAPDRPPAPEAASKVGLGFPLLKDVTTQKYVGTRISGYIGALRACYDRALLAGAPLPSPATTVLSFAVSAGTPTLILVRDAGGLPGAVTSCVTDEVSRWAGLFPESGDYAKSQELAVTFTALASSPAAANGGASGPVGPR